METAELADALGGLLDRVEAARAEGEQALEAARVFAAAASHELRTPLTTLRTDLDVLRAHPELPPEERATVLEELRTSQTGWRRPSRRSASSPPEISPTSVPRRRSTLPTSRRRPWPLRAAACRRA